MTPELKPRKRRRLLKYGLLILVLSLGVHFGFVKVAEAKQQRLQEDQRLLAEKRLKMSRH